MLRACRPGFRRPRRNRYFSTLTIPSLLRFPAPHVLPPHATYSRAVSVPPFFFSLSRAGRFFFFFSSFEKTPTKIFCFFVEKKKGEKKGGEGEPLESMS